VILTDWIDIKNALFRRAALTYAFVAVVGFLLVVVNAKLLPLFFLVVGVGLFLLDKKFLLVTLYVIYVPTNGLINRTDFIVGLLGIQQILSLLVFASLLRIKVSSRSATDMQKIAGSLLILLLTYVCYTYFKNAYFGLLDTSWSEAVKKSINAWILYGPLVLLIRKSVNDTMKGWLAVGSFLGVLNQAIFCFLSPFLPQLGFYSQGTEAFFSSGADSEVSRYVGIMGNGDSNTLGVFFVVAVGFYLSRAASFNRSLMIKLLCGICILAIALTASRSAFLTLIIVGMIFLVNGGSKKVRFQLVLGALLIAVISSPLWDSLLSRLTSAGAEQLSTDTSGNRIGKWLLYFQHFIDNPMTFVRGSSKTLYIGFNDIFLAAHNFYIQVVYNAGLGFLFLFLLQYFKLFKWMLHKASVHNLIYIVLPFLAITLFVSDYGIFMYFCVFLALNTTKFATASKEQVLQSVPQ
jgi:hypothetical protein